MRLCPPLPVVDDAEFGTGDEHRYWLSRRNPDVHAAGPVGLCLALNPSKAGVTGDDPTVRKWRGFTTRWGWSGFWVGNLFAFVETESSKLRQLGYEHAIGRHNDAVLISMIQVAPEILLCWGNNVPDRLKGRVSAVLDLVLTQKQPSATVSHLGLTAQGAPWHPLRLGYDTPRQPWVFKEKVSRR